MIFTWPCDVSIMLAALMSRWTMPFACAVLQPSADLHGDVERLFERSGRARRVSPAPPPRRCISMARTPPCRRFVDLVDGADVWVIQARPLPSPRAGIVARLFVREHARRRNFSATVAIEIGVLAPCRRRPSRPRRASPGSGSARWSGRSCASGLSANGIVGCDGCHSRVR